MKKIIFQITTLVVINLLSLNLLAQTESISGNTSFSGTVTTSNGSYTYNATVKYKSTLFGGTVVKAGITSFNITGVKYKGVNASQVNTLNFPISVNKVQMDLQTTVVYSKPNTTRTKAFDITMKGVGQGYGDYTYLSKEQGGALKKAFNITNPKVEFYQLNIDFKNTTLSTSGYIDELDDVKKKIDTYLKSNNSNNQSGSNNNNGSSSSSSSNNSSSVPTCIGCTPAQIKAMQVAAQNKNKKPATSTSYQDEHTKHVQKNNSRYNSSSSTNNNTYTQNSKPAYTGPTQAERDAEWQAGYDKVMKGIDNDFAFYEKQNREMAASIKQISDNWIEQDRRISSYNNFKENINSLTRISPSNDPKQIISEYNNKVRGLEREYSKRLQQRISNINRDVATLKTQAKGEDAELIKGLVDLGGAGATINADVEIKKAKQKAKQDLYNQKHKLLSIIHNNLVADFTKKSNKYKIKAAAEPYQNMETYYKQVAQHYDCKISGVKNGFSVTNTSWADPYCSVPQKPSYRSKAPSSADLYAASQRKKQSSDENDQKYAGKFLDMAIKKSPSNTTYLFERASYYPLGSRDNLNYLARCVSAKPRSSKYKDHYDYAYALNKEKSPPFKLYLKNHPKGLFASKAKNKYAYYLDREIKEILYHQDIKRLNELMSNESFAEASFMYSNLKKTDFYNNSDITQLTLLKEYRNYDNATNRKTADLLMGYLRSYPNGKWKNEVKGMLEPALIIDADKAAKSGDEDNAFRYYDSYLSYFPNGDNANYAREKKNSAQYEIMKSTIHEGNYAFENEQYKKSKLVFDSYITTYPTGEDHLYAKKMSKKSFYKDRLSTLNMNQQFWSYSYTSNAGFTIVSDFFTPKLGFYFGVRLGGLFFDQSLYQINERGNFEEEYDETPLNKNLFRDLDEIRFSSITLPVGINYPITHRWWLYGGFGIGSVQSYRKYEDRSENSEIWVRDKTIGSFRFTLDVGVKVHLDFITFQLGLSKYPESLKLAFGLGILFNH